MGNLFESKTVEESVEFFAIVLHDNGLPVPHLLVDLDQQRPQLLVATGLDVAGLDPEADRGLPGGLGLLVVVVPPLPFWYLTGPENALSPFYR